MELRTAVGIPTYLRDSVLVDTIRQVLAQQPPADEVIVVDQTLSHDEETETFLREHSERGLIRHFRQEQPSVTKARNRVLAEAESDIVIYLDDDVQLSPGLFAKHVRHYSDPAVKLVAGAFLRQWQVEEHLRELKTRPGTRPADLHDDVRGGNMSVIRSAAIAAGGFDENFIGPAQGEENDFAVRFARIEGGKQIYDPEAWLLHLKAPVGGCRIITTQNAAWTEWEKSYNVWLMGIRHYWPHSLVFIKRAFLSGPRRQENVLRFWRQPLAWLGFFYGALVAFRKRNQLLSPFAASAKSRKI
jgi:glycosyltransferase involved in cell wall biosynthesis